MRPGHVAAAAALLAACFLALTLPVIFTGRGGTSEAGDQVRYHLPTVEQFA